MVQALELENRKRIYDLVVKHPGHHLRELARLCSEPLSTIRYHLNFLAKHNLVQVQKDGNHLRYFHKEFKVNKPMMALRQPSARKILLILLTQKIDSADKIAKLAKLSPSTVSWHLSRLEENSILQGIEILERERLIKLLITYQESFLDRLVDNAIEMFG